MRPRKPPALRSPISPLAVPRPAVVADPAADGGAAGVAAPGAHASVHGIGPAPATGREPVGNAAPALPWLGGAGSPPASSSNRKGAGPASADRATARQPSATRHAAAAVPGRREGSDSDAADGEPSGGAAAAPIPQQRRRSYPLIPSLLERHARYTEKHNRELAAARARQEERDAAELTFKPRINAYAGSGRAQLGLLDRMLEARVRQALEAKRLRQEREERELAAATFKPVISAYASGLRREGAAHERLYAEGEEWERARQLAKDTTAEQLRRMRIPAVAQSFAPPGMRAKLARRMRRASGSADVPSLAAGGGGAALGLSHAEVEALAELVKAAKGKAKGSSKRKAAGAGAPAASAVTASAPDARVRAVAEGATAEDAAAEPTPSTGADADAGASTGAPAPGGPAVEHSGDGSSASHGDGGAATGSGDDASEDEEEEGSAAVDAAHLSDMLLAARYPKLASQRAQSQRAHGGVAGSLYADALRRRKDHSDKLEEEVRTGTRSAEGRANACRCRCAGWAAPACVSFLQPLKSHRACVQAKVCVLLTCCRSPLASIRPFPSIPAARAAGADGKRRPAPQDGGVRCCAGGALR